MSTYSIHSPKNLHGRVVQDNGGTVTFTNSDGQLETQPVIDRRQSWVEVLSNKDGFLRLWL